jgi:hypothetical protein
MPFWKLFPNGLRKGNRFWMYWKDSSKGIAEGE